MEKLQVLLLIKRSLVKVDIMEKIMDMDITMDIPVKTILI